MWKAPREPRSNTTRVARLCLASLGVALSAFAPLGCEQEAAKGPAIADTGSPGGAAGEGLSAAHQPASSGGAAKGHPANPPGKVGPTLGGSNGLGGQQEQPAPRPTPKEAPTPAEPTEVASPAEPPLHSCEFYDDRRAASARRVIFWNYDVQKDAAHCMTIAVGQSVTWSGNFSWHPLAGRGGDAGNPIAEQLTGSADYTVRFEQAGLYGYVCESHVEMRGAVRVLKD